MKKFKVYKHPVKGFEAVKIGFSWPAFLFGVIWMLTKKLWGFAAIWLGIYFIAGIVEAIANESPSAPTLQGIVYLILFGIYIALWLIPCFKGNKWRENDLSKRGYKLIDTVEAETPDAAIALIVTQGKVKSAEHDL